MAAAITSWVLNPIQSLIMSRPRTRKLWCALSGDLQSSFFMECVADQDDIDTLRKKIWDRSPARFEDTLTDYSELKLYSPVVQLNYEEEFRIGDGEFLLPRRMITSNPLFPESKDPGVDIVVVSRDTTTRKRKRSESQSANIPWTQPIAEDPRVCPRKHTVSELAAILDEVNIVHVRGTPASGKTYLSELLRDHYCKEGRKAFLITEWEKLNPKNPWGSLIKLVEKSNEQLEDAPTTSFTTTSSQSEQDPFWILTSNTVILVDEAQMTYNDAVLWNTILKKRQSSFLGYNFRLCLFCSYGSPEAGPDQTFFTPVRLSNQQCISLTPQSRQGSPSIGLFYDKEEFKDVVSRSIPFEYQKKFTFDEGAQDYIFALSNGHPGAVESILNTLFQAYRHDIKHGHMRTLTEDHVIWFLEDTARVFQKLSMQPVHRSFPHIERCTNGISNILNTITETGSVPFDLNDADIKFCYQKGWIHRVALDSDDIAVLPSRLHEKYIEYSIGTMSQCLPARFDSLPKLCKEILRKFSIMNLKHSAEGKKMSSASQPRPVEAQYQDEFYRGFTHVAGRGVPISSEWSRTRDGRVDFYIPEKQWAVELLRNHDKVDEHISRFKEGGKYHPWLKENKVKNWIIIDCATSLPIKEFSEPKLWHAVFANDYSELQLYNHQKALIMHVHLHN